MPRLSQFTRRSLVALVVLAVFGIAALVYVPTWLAYRFTHSISRDSFVESHLVNLSPQVAGNVVTIFVQEQEGVKKGQLLAVIDPSIYQREVDLAAAKLDVANAALAKAKSDLQLLQEQVPQQIAEAEANLAVARDHEAKAAAAVPMVEQNVNDAVAAAEHQIAAIQAALVLAEEDFSRYGALLADGSATQRKFQEATKARGVAEAERKVAEARLGQAQANRRQVDIANEELAAAKNSVGQAEAALALAKLGSTQITVLQRQVDQRQQDIAEAQRGLQLAQTNLGYTQITAPFECVIAKKWRHLGDYARTGDPLFCIYNPNYQYVTVHLEETRLEGVNPGNWATLNFESYSRPFRGRVVWIGSATGANFSLIPRDLSSGEFTYVVQRVPVRIAIERDDRWQLLKPGLSVTVDIEHGAGDPKWAAEEWERERAQADIEVAPAGNKVQP